MKYFGSVRFFKNMILLVVVIAIAIPTILAIYYGSNFKACVMQNKANARYAQAQEALRASLKVDVIDYQTLYPDFYAPQVYQADQRDSDVVYLTFDGSLSSQLDDLLDLLSENNAQATFFVSGAVDAQQLKKVAFAGHTIGMLTWSDDYLSIYNSVESYLTDMYQIFNYIQEATGYTPTMFRCLGGSINSYNSNIYQQIIAEMIRRGFVPCDWNINLGESITSISGKSVVEQTAAQLGVMDRAVLRLTDSVSLDTIETLLDMLDDKNFSCKALTYDVKPVLFAYSN